MINEDVKKNFSSIPVNEDESMIIEATREQFAIFAQDMNNRLPDGRLKSIMMTKLEEACMFAIKSISHK
jgi:hypothetical protein